MANFSQLRPAILEDIPEIVRLIADDPLGMQREDYQDPLPQKYFEAFLRIRADPNQELMVMENEAGENY